MGVDPSDIRNVAVVGHRGAGKTALTEAMLFQAEAINRLGSIGAGNTVSDWAEDEQKRQMSLTASLAHLNWGSQKVNIIDSPGDPGFIADSLAAFHVVEIALHVINGVAGLEVQTGRYWSRANDLGLVSGVFVNMLDRERADFDTVVESLRGELSANCVPVSIPVGEQQNLSGVIDVLTQKMHAAGDDERAPAPADVPADEVDVLEAAREELIEAIVETDEDLMGQYLEGDEISHDTLGAALRKAVMAGELVPVFAGSATRNLGIAPLLEVIAQACPSPADAASADGDGPSAAFVFKTLADPFAGKISVFRVVGGTISGDSTLVNSRTSSKERIGQLLIMQGKEHESKAELPFGDLGAVAKLKDTTTGDVLAAQGASVEVEPVVFPDPVMSFAVSAKDKGDEDKVAASLRRLAEEDPTLVIRRDEQTGEQLLAGMSQVHVEVAVDRLKQRFGVDVALQPPQVPYVETIRKESRSRARYKKQTGGRGQFGDCEIVIEPRDGHEGYEFLDEIVGGVIPQSFRPAVDKGIQESMIAGDLAGAPVKGVRVRLVDGQAHNVDSSEMAFKIAGSMAFKDAYSKANPVLLEPVMALDVTVPDDTVGGVNGDLNQRRGRLLGMEPVGGLTTVKAEVPLAEVLTYGQSLTSLTGGRGDYTMSFLRYEEVPTHVAQKVMDDAKRHDEDEGS